MKKISLFFAALAVSAMAMAADAIVTSTFTSKKWAVGTGELEWEASQEGYAKTTDGVQVTLASIKTTPLTLSNDSIQKLGNGIKKVEIAYKSNRSKEGDGVLSVKVGDTSFGDAYNVQQTTEIIAFENATAVKGEIVITLTSAAESKSVYIKSISVTYEKNQSSDPTISARALDFGAYVIGISEAKELVVEGENLTDAISYAWQTGGLFSADGTLTAEGGTLNIDVIATTDVEAVDSLVLTSGATVTKVAVKANAIATVGAGTKENPFTVVDVKKMNNAIKQNAWVVGYIAGCAANGGKIAATNDSTNLLLVAAMTDSIGIPVALVAKTNVRKDLNIVDHPGNKGAQVKVYGSLEGYFGVAGMKSTSDYEIISTPTSLISTEAKKQVRKAMIGGQMVIIREGKMFNALGAEL